MPRTCINKANNFCYICSEVTFSSQKRSITAVVRKAYYLYFECKVGDQDKTWAPHICCNITYTSDVKLAIKTKLGHLTFVATPVLQIFDKG